MQAAPRASSCQLVVEWWAGRPGPVRRRLRLQGYDCRTAQRVVGGQLLEAHPELAGNTCKEKRVVPGVEDQRGVPGRHFRAAVAWKTEGGNIEPASLLDLWTKDDFRLDWEARRGE